MENKLDNTVSFELLKPRASAALLTLLREQPVETASAEPKADESAESGGADDSITVSYVPIGRIRTSQLQLRQIEDSSLQELTHSIRERGILQPILLRPSKVEPGALELIAGERRYRAAKLAGLESVPALVTDVTDRDSLELAIIENAQREDLNPIEEALAYKRLADDFRLTQVEIAEAIGKNRATISNAVRLLQLDEEIIELIRGGELSAGHGRALLMIKEPGLRARVAQNAVRNLLSVRALEKLVDALNDPTASESESDSNQEDLSLARYQAKFSEALGSELIKVRRDKQGRRVVNITFDTEATWRRFVARMKE